VKEILNQVQDDGKGKVQDDKKIQHDEGEGLGIFLLDYK